MTVGACTPPDHMHIASVAGNLTDNETLGGGCPGTCMAPARQTREVVESDTRSFSTPSSATMNNQTTPSNMTLNTYSCPVEGGSNDYKGKGDSGAASGNELASGKVHDKAAPETEDEVICLNLSTLLPKKSKHGRIGGSLYRALRDAGVDVAALGIPRGRPPRTKVGQKRPKRPTLLSFIKSGAELPMVPGAPRLRIVNMDLMGDGEQMVEVEEPTVYGQGLGLRQATNKQRVTGRRRRSDVDKEDVDDKRLRGMGKRGEEPTDLAADEAAATELLLLLGENNV